MVLQGKTALIIGGGTGIGAGVALAFAEAGAQVAISGRRIEKLGETAARFLGQPAIQCHACDVADREQTRELIDWATKQLGRIDILVQCAGINIPKRSMDALDPSD